MQAFQLINAFLFFLILFYYLHVSLSFQSQGTVSFQRPSLVSKTGKCSTKQSQLKMYISEISFYPYHQSLKALPFPFIVFIMHTYVRLSLLETGSPRTKLSLSLWSSQMCHLLSLPVDNQRTTHFLMQLGCKSRRFFLKIRAYSALTHKCFKALSKAAFFVCFFFQLNKPNEKTDPFIWKRKQIAICF